MSTPALRSDCLPAAEDSELSTALSPPLQRGGPPPLLLLRRRPVPPESQAAADDPQPAPGDSLRGCRLTTWKAVFMVTAVRLLT